MTVLQAQEVRRSGKAPAPEENDAGHAGLVAVLFVVCWLCGFAQLLLHVVRHAFSTQELAGEPRRHPVRVGGGRTVSETRVDVRTGEVFTVQVPVALAEERTVSETRAHARTGEVPVALTEYCGDVGTGEVAATQEEVPEIQEGEEILEVLQATQEAKRRVAETLAWMRTVTQQAQVQRRSFQQIADVSVPHVVEEIDSTFVLGILQSPASPRSLFPLVAP